MAFCVGWDIEEGQGNGRNARTGRVQTWDSRLLGDCNPLQIKMLLLREQDSNQGRVHQQGESERLSALQSLRFSPSSLF